MKLLSTAIVSSVLLPLAALGTSVLAQSGGVLPSSLPAAEIGAAEIGAERDWKPFIVEHYQKNARRIAESAPAGLSEEQRACRAKLAVELYNYADQGANFPPGDVPGKLVPYFIDAQENFCAVANLMRATGDTALARRISQLQNHAFVAELYQDAELQQWLAKNGLTAAEAARIQMPKMPLVPPKPRVPPKPYEGPGDGAQRPAGGGPAPQGPTPRNGGPVAAGPATPTTTTPMPGGSILTPAAPPDWQMWWELNKIEFLQMSARDVERASAAVLTGRSELSGDADSGRDPATVPAAPDSAFLVNLTKHADAGVRAAAAITLGRLGGDHTTAPLLQLLHDPNDTVRSSALLALGASASEKAVAPLVRMAVDGKLAGESARVSPEARALATVALALGRQRGFSATVEPISRWIWLSPDPAEKLDTHVAALLYQTIAPFEILDEDVARDIRNIEKNITIRARGLETLGMTHSELGFDTVVSSLRDRDVRIRRSAALALASYARAEAVPFLTNTLDSERDDFARGALLLAFARTGGPEAKSILIHELESGAARMRPWAALAGGIYSRLHPSASIAAQLYQAAQITKNASDRDAFAIALGLAGSQESRMLLKEWLASKTATLRASAAQGLALAGVPDAAVWLRAALATEREPDARVEMGLALAITGGAKDIGNITETLSDRRGSRPAGYLALAATIRPSMRYHSELLTLARDDKADAATRAVALLALGAIYDPSKGFRLAATLRNANFELFNNWQWQIAPIPL